MEGFLPFPVSAIDTAGNKHSVSEGTAYVRTVLGGRYELKVFTGRTTAVQETQVSSLPTELTLRENYPNPFNPTTTIQFGLHESGRVRLVVYNILGELEAVVVDDYRKAGYHSATWDATGVASGLYFARLETRGEVRQIKMMVLR